MGIFDNDGFGGDDFFKADKPKDGFRLDFSGYGKAVGDALAGSAGGDGGVLPEG